MKAKVVRVGNSRGVRIPKELLDLYGVNEGDTLELEERREGILLRRTLDDEKLIGYGEAYREMAAEAAEHAEWQDWDDTLGDGLDD
ncbi:MAG: AbrB/MazE/SpoVT family DNA-binding domain-containing protein [Spirochaetaceae bacterium]